MNIDMSQFNQVFFEESAEHLSEMERLLLALDVASPDSEDLNAIFRAAHSIKGGSGTFGFTDMAEVTHVLENLLDRMRKGEMAPTPEIVNALLSSVDVIRTQLDGHIAGQPAPPDAAEDIISELKTFTDPGEAPPAPASPAQDVGHSAPGSSPRNSFRILFRPDREFMKRPKSMESLKEELSRLGTLEITPPEETGGGKKGRKGEAGAPWTLSLTTDSGEEEIRNIFAFIAPPEAVEIAASPPSAESSSPLTDGDGYGFFTEAPDGDTQTAGASEKLTDGEGYGFFTDAPGASPSPEPAKATAPVPSPSPHKESAKTPAATDPAKGRDKGAPGMEASIRVSVERVDQLINLVGELVITQAMLAQTSAGVDPVIYEKMHTGLAQLERNTRDLQESVMSIRMMPISFVFSRFPRLVHDLATKLDKKVELVTVGETTELDKGLIEKISDPLTHLVRNSLDHGIEHPDERVAAGKPPAGTITLSASHQGGNIIIEVTDDGRGLNREKILKKASERGLPVSETMADNDVWMLIFEPGFSTAEVVTDVSGRGVGMDVVKRNVAEMGGTVQIRTLSGYGTTITIRLPLTLAILDGMSVSLGGDIYLIPLNMIIETLKPQASDIRSVTSTGQVVQVRGEYLPIVALHHIFNMPAETEDPTQGVLIIIEAEGRKGALFVDALVGQQQVVIKSLETNFKKVQGISGATIMGDGKVAMILDIAALLKMVS
jgi:two-component system chemotaxis sensor kinase CheA